MAAEQHGHSTALSSIQMLTSMLQHAEGRAALSLLGGREGNSETPVHVAAHRGDVDILTIMLQHAEGRAALSLQAADQATPVHVAAAMDDSRMLAVMLQSSECSAALSIQDAAGRTPLDLAARLDGDGTLHADENTLHHILWDPQGKAAFTLLGADQQRQLLLMVARSAQPQRKLLVSMLQQRGGRDKTFSKVPIAASPSGTTASTLSLQASFGSCGYFDSASKGLKELLYSAAHGQTQTQTQTQQIADLLLQRFNMELGLTIEVRAMYDALHAACLSSMPLSATCTAWMLA